MQKEYYWKLPVLAVTISDHAFFGCPHCGQKKDNKGAIIVHTKETAIWQCGSSLCKKITCLLPEGVNKSRLPFSDKKGNAFIPTLQEHPFSDIKHSKLSISHLRSISETKPTSH